MIYCFFIAKFRIDKVIHFSIGPMLLSGNEFPLEKVEKIMVLCSFCVCWTIWCEKNCKTFESVEYLDQFLEYYFICKSVRIVSGIGWKNICVYNIFSSLVRFEWLWRIFYPSQSFCLVSSGYMRLSTLPVLLIISWLHVCECACVAYLPEEKKEREKAWLLFLFLFWCQIVYQICQVGHKIRYIPSQVSHSVVLV